MASPSSVWLVVLTNGAFVFFAAFYAALYTLLTGDVRLGSLLASLSLVRLGAGLALVPR